MKTIQRTFLFLGVMAAAVTFGLGVEPTIPKANAAVSVSGGTTNPNDLPAMASAKVRATWGGWTITSSTLRPNRRSVTVQARNYRGTGATFTVPVIVRVERGVTWYYLGDVSAPQ